MVVDPVLATFWRGPLCEARIRGHVAVVDSSGSLVASLGDPTIVISPRSCAKPLQALAFVRGAMDAIGAGSADLADGCGLPTYGIRLAALARGFAASLADPAFVRCQDAMAAHPHLVGGRGRFDTALLAEAGRTLTAKIGAAGVWVAVARPAGPAVAIKIDSGESEAMAPIAIATLQHLGMLPQDGLGELAAFGRPALRNWAGTVVGEIRTA